jgi:hypothetical protein
MKAAETYIVWEPVRSDDYTPRPGRAPPGSMALGPLNDIAWDEGYMASGGCAYVYRREPKCDQDYEVLHDWFRLVHTYGLDPYLVHLGFLHIDEYQTITKNAGCGPDRGELGHDPDFGFGRVCRRRPIVHQHHADGAWHFWPGPGCLGWSAVTLRTRTG